MNNEIFDWFDRLCPPVKGIEPYYAGWTAELASVAMPVRNWFAQVVEGLPGFVEVMLQPPGDSPETRYARCDRPDELTELAVIVAEANIYHGCGAFFAPCPRFDRREPYQRGREQDAILVPALWVDLDDNRLTALESLLRFNPSAVLNTGGGYHAYWLLNEPAEPTDYVKRVLRGLARLFNADTQVAEFSRVMRLVGSIHNKPERNRHRVSYEHTDLLRRYALADFEQYAEPPTSHVRTFYALPDGMTRDLPEWALERIQAGSAPGSRNSDLFFLAATCCEHGMSETDTVGMFSHWQSPDFSEREIEATVKSAFQRGKRGNLRGVRPDRRMTNYMLNKAREEQNNGTG